MPFQNHPQQNFFQICSVNSQIKTCGWTDRHIFPTIHVVCRKGGVNIIPHTVRCMTRINLCTTSQNIIYIRQLTKNFKGSTFFTSVAPHCGQSCHDWPLTSFFSPLPRESVCNKPSKSLPDHECLFPTYFRPVLVL